MKYTVLLLAVIVFTSPLYAADQITITKLDGKVEVKEPGGNWLKAKEGNTVPQGSLISTGFKSSAKLDLSGTSTIYIKQLTRMSVDKLVSSGKKVDTKLNLKLGRIRADVKTSKGLKHDFTLRTPVSTAAVKGTVFEGGANGDLDVERGQVQQKNRIGQSATVSGGNSSTVSGSGFTPPATASETVSGAFNVETSTQPDNTVPPVLPPPPDTGSGSGSVTVDWHTSDHPIE